MAGTAVSGESYSLDPLVKEIISHPEFKNVLKGIESPRGQEPHRQTPIQEFRRIFNRPANNPPQYTGKAWVPSSRGVPNTSSLRIK